MVDIAMKRAEGKKETACVSEKEREKEREEEEEEEAGEERQS